MGDARKAIEPKLRAFIKDNITPASQTYQHHIAVTAQNMIRQAANHYQLPASAEAIATAAATMNLNAVDSKFAAHVKQATGLNVPLYRPQISQQPVHQRIRVPMRDDWDESQHPREPAGTPEGGRFAGGAAAGEGHGWVPPTAAEQAATKKADSERFARLAKKLDYPPEKITLSYGKGEAFVAGGVHLDVAGQAFGDGTIEIFPRNVSSEYAPPEVAEEKSLKVLAHEVMHTRYSDVDHETTLEKRAATQGVDPLSKQWPFETQTLKTLREPEGRPVDVLKEEHAADYPALALQAHFYRNYEQFVKEDGVTQYSSLYWKDYTHGTGTLRRAVDETLAEIAGLKATGELRARRGGQAYGLTATLNTVTPLWRDYYNKIHEMSGPLQGKESDWPLLGHPPREHIPTKEEIRRSWQSHDWSEEDHPRVPAGTSEGGQFAGGAGGVASAPAQMPSTGRQVGVTGDPSKGTEDSALRKGEIERFTGYAKELGYPIDKIELRYGTQTFTAGGEKQTSAGTAYRDGRIEISPRHIGGDWLNMDDRKILEKQVLVHEIMHQRYNAVQKKAVEEENALKERHFNEYIGEKAKLMKAGVPERDIFRQMKDTYPFEEVEVGRDKIDVVKPEFAKDNPALALQGEFYRNYSKFAREDGVNRYSGLYWDDYYRSRQNPDKLTNAVHETLAVMAELKHSGFLRTRTEGQGFGGGGVNNNTASPLWQNWFNKVYALGDPLMKQQFPAHDWNPDQPRVPAGQASGGQWAGGEGVDLTKVKLIWPEPAPKTPEEQAARRQVESERYKGFAKKLGYPPDKVVTSYDDYHFDLGGAQHTAAATAGWDGTITVYPDNIWTAESGEGVMAHEVMHERYALMDDQAKTERAALSKKWDEEFMARHELVEQFHQAQPLVGGVRVIPPLPATIPPPVEYPFRDVKVGDYKVGIIKPKFDKANPHAAVEAQFFRHLSQFVKEDGVTDYSKQWWGDYEKDKTPARLHSAVNETLAEMAKLSHMGKLGERHEGELLTQGTMNTASKRWYDWFQKNRSMSEPLLRAKYGPV